MKKLFLMLFTIILLLAGCGPEPDIKISGVDADKMYPKAQTININEALAGNYTMTLNGEHIDNNHLVSREGDYTLTIDAKRWWNEQSKTIKFEIDSKPPHTPTFKKKVRESYYQQVKFEIDKDEAVIYTATLDGKPFDMNNLITEEGHHRLSVIAEKANGLFAEKQVEFFIDNQTYTKQEYDKFEQFVFDNFGEVFYFPAVIKWMDSVDVFVHGKLTAEDRRMLDQHIMTINDLLPFDLILNEEQKEKRENRIDIHFVPNYQFDDYGFADYIIDDEWEVVGFANPTKITDYGEIKTSTIGIATNTYQTDRNNTILHELIHVLGLYNHFEDDKTSIMYPNDNRTVTSMSDSDKKIIEILYRKDIHPGMLRFDVQDVLSPRIIED